MAGAGYKLFNTGDVLTAAQVNTYLQEQTVMVFASSAARTSALSGVLAEGMMSYLQDTNAVQVYNGSAWVSVGGGASPLTTKGDLYTFSTVDARLGVGANGTVLTADSAETTGLKWATPAAGGMTLISTTTMTGGSVSLTTIAGTYKHLLLVITDTYGSNDGNLHLQFNSDTTATRYRWTNIRGSSTTLSMVTDFEDAQIVVGGVIGGNAASLDNANTHLWVYNYTQTADRVVAGYSSSIVGGTQKLCSFDGLYTGNSAAVTSIQLKPSAGTFTDGSVYLYGVA